MHSHGHPCLRRSGGLSTATLGQFWESHLETHTLYQRPYYLLVFERQFVFPSLRTHLSLAQPVTLSVLFAAAALEPADASRETASKPAASSLFRFQAPRVLATRPAC